ncbi:carbohydrate binding domain-containing protein [Deinococcus cellulosilyticus]|uniref:GH16 domain-containing protein n=1 Tax=Deinococcus cellulosilyticus (strain DSM 18568 / NBRC 106333 / KACC 11606 / 5516J-15) TaxID=1223518 RepID=A0A511N966_DEIC1|nr:carbohydrate binding domain-containing protein [Deinococcus cellulosilyticus]GEM49340.1 hypothetical protein DC3_49750 [Deinococcus cellulosilyticus NBRC 106333 = KACC 11606]
MKVQYRAVLGLGITLSLMACNPNTPTPDGTVWKDEFNGTALDTTKWGYQIGNGFGGGESPYVAGWGNNELEYYTDRPQNVSLKDGKLVITAIKEDYKGLANGVEQTFGWTSGRIRTAGKFSRTYGKFEIRAKLPTGRGLWPAIWMLPEDQPGNPYGTWAANGEIDIMEAWGSKPGKVAHTIHYGGMWPNNTSSGKEFLFPEGQTIADWHTYTLEWRSNEMKWYVDGVLTATKTQWWSSKANPPSKNEDLAAWPAPFDKPFYLLLNLAVGGNFDGNPDATTPTKAQMEIDYVKVWGLQDENRDPGARPDMMYPWTPRPQRPPLDDGNLIYNNSFDWADNDPCVKEDTSTLPDVAKSYFWTNFTEGATYTMSNDAANGNSLKVDITNDAGPNYGVQIRQDGITIKNLKKYEVSFDVWSSADRNIMVKVGGGQSRGWAAYSGEQTIGIGKTKQRKTFTFDMNQLTDAEARLEFNLGAGGKNTVWIDNVVVKEVGDVNVDMRPPTADGNLIYNGGFSEEAPTVDGIPGVDKTDYWSFYQEKNNVTTSVVNGEVKLAVSNVNSAEFWYIQLNQKNVPIVKDQKYRLTFKAHASDARKVEVVIGDDGAPYGRYLNQQVDITADTKTYSYEFTGPQTNNKAILQILGATGAGSYDLFFDDFRLEKIN